MKLSQKYSVLELIPKKQITIIHLKCLVMNVMTLLKWILDFVKSRIYKTTFMRRSIEATEFPNKQPGFMMETNLGRHSYVKLENTKLHFVEAGNRSNPVVLLLHGFPDCWLGWRYQIGELSQYFHVIALDLKGFNDSDKPSWRYEYTPKKICEELRKFLIAMSAKSVTIIGHDLGALVGWTFAHTNPEMVDKFISVSTPHPNLLWDDTAASSPFNSKWLQFIQLPCIPEMEMKHNAASTLKKCHSHVQKEKSYVTGNNGTIKNSLTDAYLYTFSQTDDWRGPLNYYRTFMFYRIKVGEILQCPCLIITGNDDKFYKLESVVKSSDYCDNFVIKIIDHGGHWPHQETPVEFNTTILKFIIGKRNLQKLVESEKLASQRGIMDRVFGIGGPIVNATSKINNFKARASEISKGISVNTSEFRGKVENALSPTNLVPNIIMENLLAQNKIMKNFKWAIRESGIVD